MAGQIQWYAVRVRPQQRQIMAPRYRGAPADAPFMVEHWLNLRGFETFTPRRKVFRFVNGVGKKKREKVEKAFPAFVGWMFVGWPEGQNRFRDLLDCPGVSGLGELDGPPVKISEAQLRQLSRKLGTGLLTAPERERYMRTHEEFGPGEVAVVAEGSLADLEVKVVKINGRLAEVLLPILGQEHVVEIDAMLLRKAA